MATTDLTLGDPGSLPRPGPFGRLARLGLGALCAWYVIVLWLVRDHLMAGDSPRPLIWNGVPIGLFLVSYIINIGYSRAWKKWPAFFSAAVLAIIAAYGFVTSGSLETGLLARVVWVWEFYLFLHLGAAFLIAAVIATPGCEMRAFHDLFSRVSGIGTKEHYCPVGPLHPIDRWEARKRDGG